MKRLLVIISILVIIFIGMFIYKNNKNKTAVTASEVENIERYISNIYMWKEITNEALPKFDNINNAPELWLWEVVKKNLEEYELTYEQINSKAKEIFGENLSKEFPIEGTEYIIYDNYKEKYYVTGIGLDAEDDSFLINKIQKIDNIYKVEIIEYIEDYSNAINPENNNDVYDVDIKNLRDEKIAAIKSNESETKAIEVIKKNANKFTKKVINLDKNSEGKIFVKSVE